MADERNVVDDDIARFARARELELATRAPPLACGADLSCYRHIVHRHPPFVYLPAAASKKDAPVRVPQRRLVCPKGTRRGDEISIVRP